MMLITEGIREASTSEHEQIVDIDKACFIHSYDIITYRKFLRRCPRSRILVVVERNRVLGFCLYEAKRNGLTRRRELVLIRFAVAPDSHRRGIGRRLLSAVQRKAEVCDAQVITCANEGELWSHQFLKACGFYCNRIMELSDGTNYQFVYPYDEADS